MILLFHRTGNDWTDGFETAAALEAGFAVRAELRPSAAAQRANSRQPLPRLRGHPCPERSLRSMDRQPSHARTPESYV